MKNTSSKTVRQYSLALVSVLAFIALRWMLNPLLGTSAPLILFLLPVVFSAWLGGFGPGIVATLVSLILGLLLFVPGTFSLEDSDTILFHWSSRGLPFFFVGVTISFLAARLEAARAEAKEKADEARVSEDFVRRVMSSSADCIKVLDLEGNLLSINEAGAKLLEVSDAASLLHTEWASWWIGEGGTRAAAAVVDAKSGHTASFVAFSPTFAGTPKWWDVAVSPIPDRDGKPERLLSVARDITERRESDLALRRSEELQGRIFESVRDFAIFTTDLKGMITSWNIGAERLFGYNEAEATTMEFSAIFTPEDRLLGVPQRELNEALSTGKSSDDRWHLRKDNSRFFASGVATPLLDEMGIVSGFAKVARDITARKITEQERENLLEALERSEAQFKKLADAMPQIVWAAQPDGTLDYYNRRWFAYVNMRPENVDEARWDRFIHPDDLELVKKTWSDSLKTGDPYYIEFRVRGADHLYRWFLVRALPIFDEEGAISRWFGTCTDVEDYKELELQKEQLLASERAARATAEHASRMKDDFLATLSHELRTPLNAIFGWTQLLKRNKENQKVLLEGIDIIDRNVRIQTQLIDDLLDMSRIISGKVRLTVRPLNLIKCIDDAVETVMPAAVSKNITIAKTISPIAKEIVGDHGRIQQVIWNLLSNAIKFTPRDGSVQVLSHQVGNFIEIQVVDSGQGISTDFLPYVFDRFRQADGATNRKHGGLGLGLAIVKQMVELHGGNVRVMSKGEGTGTTFTVSLPFHVVSQTVEKTKKGGDPRSVSSLELLEADLTGLKVLVLDDEADARELLKRVLEEFGAEVRIVGSALEGIALFKNYPPDIVVSDIGMPEIDGYEFLKRVKAIAESFGTNIQAIALTAFAREEDKAKAFAVGFSRHMSKPVEPSELVTAIAELCNRK